MITKTRERMDGSDMAGQKRASKTRIGKALAAAVLAAGIMLGASSLARADEADIPARGRIFASMYDRGKSPSIGMGLSKGFALPLGFQVDASMALSSSGKTVELESAGLDLTTPKLGSVSGTFYAYKDRFYYVDFGYGAMLNAGNLHVALEYIGDNWGDAFAKYVIHMGRVRLIPKVVMLFSEKKVEALGGEATAELDVGGVTLFGKIAHSRSVQTGDWMNGNMQAGMSFKF
jgi:hypothetical protein